MPKIDAPSYLKLKSKDFRDGVSPFKSDGIPLYKRLNEPALRRLKELALNDFWAFIDLLGFHGGTKSFYPIHKELAEFLSSTWEKRLVLMPRGHYKSTFCSTLYVLWRIYQNPNIRIMVGSAGKELAIGFVRTVQQLFENPELQHYIWNSRPHIEGALVPDLDRTGSKRKRGKSRPDDIDDDGAYGGYLDDIELADGKKVIWRANAIQVLRPKIEMKEPTLFACSVGVMMAGWHYDLAIFDDICTKQNASDPAKMKKILNWVDDISSVIDPRGLNGDDLGEELVILGTRYYKWDYYGHLMGEDLDAEEEKQEYWDTIDDDPLHVIQRDIYGNGFGCKEHGYRWVQEMYKWNNFESPHYMCPKLMNPTRERKLRRRKEWFFSQYLNLIFDPEASLLDYSYINFIHPLQVERRGKQWVLKLTNEPDESGVYLNLVTVVDPAASTSKTADYSVVTTGGMDEEGRLFVLDTKYGHWLPSELGKYVQAQLEKWNQARVIVEANGTQKFISNSLKEYFKEHGKTYHILEEIPSGDKKQNILDALEPKINDRKLYFMNWIAGLSEPREEMQFFPQEGARDDFLDTLKMLVKYTKPTKPRDARRKNTRYRMQKVNKKYGGIR